MENKNLDKRGFGKILIKVALSLFVVYILPLGVLYYFSPVLGTVFSLVLLLYAFYPEPSLNFIQKHLWFSKILNKIKNELHIREVTQMLTSYNIFIYKTINKLF